RPQRRNRTWLWLPTTLVILLIVIALTLFSPQVAAAMRRIFGFIPGIGLVESSAYKVLAEPYNEQRDGIDLRIENATSDAERTRILLQVEGEWAQGTASDAEDMPEPTPLDDPYLLLPDGSRYPILSADHHGNGSGDAYTYRLTFAALPQDVWNVTLALPRITHIPPGQGPEDWLIPLHFKAGDPQELQPVFEVESTPLGGKENAEEWASPEEKQEMQNATPGGKASTADPFGLSFQLDKVVPVDNGYLFMTRTGWQDTAIEPWGVMFNLESVTDAGGNAFSYEITQPDSFPAEGQREVNNAFLVNGNSIDWPVTLVVRAMEVRLKSEAVFSVDLGPNPAVGDTWQIDQTVTVGGYTIHVDSIETGTAADGHTLLRIHMHSADVMRALVVDPAQPEAVTGGGGGADIPLEGPYTFSAQMTYDSLPQDPLTLAISSLTVVARGPWQITWQPEAP
ncbi:MAG: hypothetical protein PWQ55_256, partial [Chloroflexota bacterium]|nr:hypothetical protein [Chloroflexota bacterium]